MKRQNIFIDGLGLVEGHFSGIGQYILGIIRGLDEIIDATSYEGKETPIIRVVIPYDSVEKFKSYKFKHIGYKKFPLSFRVMSGLWYRGKLPPLDLWCGRGRYIFPRFVSMPLLFSKATLVIFDLSYELHRQYSDEKNAAFLSKGVKRSVSRVKKIIVISESVKKEVTDFYNIDPSNVLVATPATDPRLFYRRSPKEIEKVKREYGIQGDYILALSNLEPRKNLGTLVNTYCNLPKDITNKIGLLLVGVDGWKTEQLFQDIKKKVELGYNILRPSEYILDKDKPAIISGAKMLVYPSHYEGFGMPPLEALACGTPVISANNSSLPEVLGNAGKMVNIDKPNELSQAIKDYMKDIDHISRLTITNGPEHARRFSWVKSAQVFLDVLKEID